MRGWLLQAMVFSAQASASCQASSVRPIAAEPAYRRRVADWTTQPTGMFGNWNRTRLRTLLLGPLDITLRTESKPLLLNGLLSSIQASALAVRVTGRASQANVIGVFVDVGPSVAVAVGGMGVFVAVGGTGVFVAVGGNDVAVGVFVAVGG